MNLKISLPKDWVYSTIADLGGRLPSTVQTGPFGTQLHAEDYVDEGIPLILIRNIRDGGVDESGIPRIRQSDADRLSVYSLVSGDIVFSRVGRVGSCFLAEEKHTGWIISGQTLRIRLPEEAIYHRYLFHALCSKPAQDWISGASLGTTRQSINTKILSSLALAVPPRPEQRRIADILDTMDTAIRQTEALIAKLKQAKAGLLHDLLTCGLDDNGELRVPEARPEQFKDSALGRIPREWEINPLGTLAEIGAGVTLGRDLNGPATVEMPYLRVANVQDGYLDLAEIRTIRVFKDEVPRFLLQPGDVLMNEGGDFDKLGRGAVWTGDISPCLHQNHVFRVRVDRKRLQPEFLAAVSGSAHGKRFFVLSSKQSTNLASINSTQLKAFPIPRPSCDEQDRIIAAIDVHKSRIRAEEVYRDKLKLQKQGLMSDLLTGRVRVTADPLPATSEAAV